MTDTNRSPSRNWLLVLAGGSLVVLCVGALVFIAISLSVFIAPNERGVVVSLYESTGYRSEILEPDYHFLKPGEKVVLFDISRQTYTMSGNSSDKPDFVGAITSDGQKIEVGVSLIFAVDPEKVLELYVTWQNRYQDMVVRPASRGITRDAVTLYTLDQILGNPDEIEKVIFDQLESTLSENYIILLKFDLIDVRRADG